MDAETIIEDGRRSGRDYICVVDSEGLQWAMPSEPSPACGPEYYNVVEITTDPDEAPADALLEAAGYYVMPGDLIQSLWSPVGMVHYHLRDGRTLGGHYEHELTGWDPYSWDVRPSAVALDHMRPTGMVTCVASLREWIVALRADDMFADVVDPTIVLDADEAKWWAINHKVDRPIVGQIHGVNIREVGHEHLEMPRPTVVMTVDIPRPWPPLAHIPTPGEPVSISLLDQANMAGTCACTLPTFVEDDAPCPKCNGTGRVAGALGVGIEWPCECVGGAG